MSDLKEPQTFTIRKIIEDNSNSIYKYITTATGIFTKSIEQISNKFENAIKKNIDSNEAISSSLEKNIKMQEKSLDTFTKAMELERDVIISKFEDIKTKDLEQLTKLNERDSFKIENIDDFPKPLDTIKIDNFPPVQVVKLKDEIKPPIINIVEKTIKFPEVQVVELKDKIKPPVINVVEKVINFPSVQKVSLTKDQKVKIDNFPPVQKVKLEPNTQVLIKNLDKIDIGNFKDIAKYINFDFPTELNISNLPVSMGKRASKTNNPSIYIPVRITDGERFIDNFGGQQIVSSNGGGGQSLPMAWTTTSGTVGTTSTLLLASNDLRRSAVITNDSSSTIYISFGQEAVLRSGVRLNANGGSFEINKTNYFAGTIHAISDTNNSNVCILETSLQVSHL